MPRRKAEGIEVLADATRRQIMALVAGHIRHPSDIASALGLSRPAVSRQLRVLVEAGLLRWRRSTIDRRSRVYAIEPTMRDPVLAWLAGVDLRRASHRCRCGGRRRCESIDDGATFGPCVSTANYRPTAMISDERKQLDSGCWGRGPPALRSARRVESRR